MLPLLQLHRNKLTRSYSGGGYGNSNNNSTSSSDSDDAPLPNTSSSAVRRGRRRTRNNKDSRASERLLVIFLGVGLVFCFVDILYMVKHISHDDPSILRAQRDQSLFSDTDITDTSDLSGRKVQTIPSDWPESETGKEPILRLLKEAMRGDYDPDVVERLPTAKQVSDLYGPPVVLGLETCERFQRSGVDPSDHFVSAAGTFNTGTNLMAELLIANCRMPARMRKYGPTNRGVRWQVVWGKHNPVFNETFRLTHRTYDDTPNLTAESIFPAVTVRDPFKWMQSMCRHSYGAHWLHDAERHCPNLVPNAVDRELAADENNGVAADPFLNVTVKYAEFAVQHESLPGFWNDWYNEYVRAPFPRLIVRFEDIVFHPKIITQTVCECAGGEMNPHMPFKYIVNSAKKGAHAHGKERTSYFDALVKYGTEAGRYTGYEAADLEYARNHLDPDLMRLFGYKYPPLFREGQQEPEQRL